MKAPISCILMRKKCFCSPITKLVEIIMGVHVGLVERVNFRSQENGRKKSISCKTIAPMSCIPMARTCLWWPITKFVEIITSIHVYLIQQMNFGSKENGRKSNFSYETKAPMSSIRTGRTHLWWPITKLVEIVMSTHVCLIQWMNFDSKENGGK